MDFKKEAAALGFSRAAVMDTKDLVFVPEYRKYCADNLCGNYDLLPACPPKSGTVEEMHERALRYEKALILQTIQIAPEMDPAVFRQAKLAHNKITEQLADRMRAEGMTDLLLMTAGPCGRHSCMSAYCVDAQKMADAVGMDCWVDDGNVRYFSLILYHPLFM